MKGPNVFMALVRFARRQKAIPRLVEQRKRRCSRCDPTGKAMERVRDQWVVAGIDKGE